MTKITKTSDSSQGEGSQFSKNGRELQELLGSKDEYQHWVKYQIERLGLTPNVDFTIHVNMVGERKNVRKETHFFTEATAHRIAGHSQVKSENALMVKDNNVISNLALQGNKQAIIMQAMMFLQQDLEEANDKLQEVRKENSILKPKAYLADKVLDADEKIDIGQAAKILELPFGRNTLFQKLREKGVFFKNKNEPKQEYVNKGYFILKEKFIERNNHDGFLVLKVLVTQKGLDFLMKVFEPNLTSTKMALVY